MKIVMSWRMNKQYVRYPNSEIVHSLEKDKTCNFCYMMNGPWGSQLSKVDHPLLCHIYSDHRAQKECYRDYRGEQRTIP